MKKVIIISHTEDAKERVIDVDLPGEWGEPAVDANGLMAWGIWDVQCGPDTLSDLAQIEGVELYDGENWRQESGWVDPVDDTLDNTEPTEDDN